MGQDAVTEERAGATAEPFDPVHERLMSAERLIFFSDAVFAIALTLLVLDLKLPELGSEVTRAGFEHALIERLGGLVAFVLSFTVIATLWSAHHGRFETVERVDPGTVQWSLILLFFVALLPMPTAMLFVPSGHSPWPLALYALNVGTCYLALNLLWRHLHRQHLTGVTDDEYRYRQLATTPVSAVFFVSIPFAFLDVRIAYLLWAQLAPLTIFVNRYLQRRYGGRVSPRRRRAARRG